MTATGLTVAAIVVTRNRLTYLQQCVEAIRHQSRRPDVLIVVDNQSDDGTAEWLREQEDVTVVTQGNEGSSGGQAAGLQQACDLGVTWVWCMDDDTKPATDCLEKLLQSLETLPPTPSFLSSLVLWKDETPHHMNVPAISHFRMWGHEVVKSRRIPCTLASFVSLLVPVALVREKGLPLRDLFIWYDDTEFTSRLSRQAPGYLVLDSIAYHETPENHHVRLEECSKENAWKFFYGLRNELFILRTVRGRNRIRLFPRVVRMITVVVTRCGGSNIPRMLHAILSGWLWYRPQLEFPAPSSDA